MSARQKLLFSILALLGVLFVGAIGYYLIEDEISFHQAVFMTVITVSTVGYGKEFDLSPAGELWTISVIIGGILVVSLAFASLQAMIVGGEFRSVMGRQKLRDRIKKMRNHYIVCGFGRMGSQIAHELIERGKQVVIIEIDPDQTAEIADHSMNYILGNASDEDTLNNAGIEHAAALVTVLRGDADNVFVALTARGMRSDLQIIARSENIDTERKLIRAGASRVICPLSIGAERIVNLLARPAVAKLVDLTMDSTEWELEEILIQEGSDMAGQTLRELNLRRRANVMVVAIHDSSGKSHVNPSADQVVNANDVLVAIGPAGAAKSLVT